MTSRSIIAVMLCATICIVVLSSSIAALYHPPGTVTDGFRDNIFDLLNFIVGTVAGYLLGTSASKEPPK